MALGLLVAHFGQFVRERHDPPARMPEEPVAFEPDLLELHKSFGHHIIPLSLLSRSDGDLAPIEQRVIVDHCLALARRSGMTVSSDEQAALIGYVAGFRPALMQLEPALHRLERDPHDDVVAFLAAAQAVIEADGVTKPAEAEFLAKLRAEFAKAG